MNPLVSRSVSSITSAACPHAGLFLMQAGYEVAYVVQRDLPPDGRDAVGWGHRESGNLTGCPAGYLDSKRLKGQAMNKDDVETFESMWHTIFADDDDDMEVELIKIEGTTVDGSRRWNRRPLMSNSNPCWQIVACGLSIVWYSEDLNLVML